MFLGLQLVTPLSQCYLSRGALFWARAKMKVRYRAQQSGVHEQSVWQSLLARARHNVWRAQRRALILQALAAKALAKQQNVPWSVPILPPFPRATSKSGGTTSGTGTPPSQPTPPTPGRALNHSAPHSPTPMRSGSIGSKVNAPPPRAGSASASPSPSVSPPSTPKPSTK
jgi:hypothetical protein